MSRILLVLLASFFLADHSFVRADTSNSDSDSLNLESQIPLPPRGATRPSGSSGTRVAAPKNTMTTIVGGLAVCLGLFFLTIWITKRHTPNGLAPLPKEVVESLGRTTLNGRQHLQLLRVGRKLVLLDVKPTGMRTLTEITDPAEVDRLVGLCQQRKPDSVTASFREVLTDYESAPTAKSFLGNANQSDFELASRLGRKRPAHREDSDV